MLSNRISKNYHLVWEYTLDNKYKFTRDGICINTKTNRIIKRTLNCCTIGFCLNGKFKSLKQIRQFLIKIEEISCPF